ncbi:MAG: serine hydrolase [Flavobacteriales bacterium]|nr:serine hydrolase [Flavobacteriales bacterium]
MMRIFSIYSILILIFISLSGCIPIKAIFLGAPDKKDIERFPHSIIEVGTDCFEFYADNSAIGQRIKVNEWSKGTPFFVTLDELAATHRTRSLLVIKNDTLLYSYYGEGTTAEDLNPSYSVAKSFTSALIGIAINEGFIKSERDLVVDYLPELKEISGSKNLRIEHLLNMTSGIKYKLQMDAILYYGRDLRKALKHIKFEHRPGTTQEYLNINIQMLGLILHQATGKKPSDYLTEKIWKPINMCSDAVWTKDRNDEDLTYCCLGATALDYAKFGRLYLNRGNWNGKQIISEEWYNKSIARDTTEGSSFGYNYCWHIGEKEYDDFMADGLYKQHIYINRKKNVIIVLMANMENELKAERVRWRNVFRQIADQL